MMLEPPVAERPVALPLTLRGRAMSTVDEYHKYARDCLRWAARARTEEQRSSWRWPTTGRKQRAGSRAGQSQPNRAASLLPLAAVRPRHVS